MMQVKAYEDIARFGLIATSKHIGQRSTRRYVMDHVADEKFDNTKMVTLSRCIVRRRDARRDLCDPPHTHGGIARV